jgi:two-component system, sensor histidine kinase
MPGWLEHWRDILTQWGFDQDTARDFFEELAKAILLLDTGVGPKAGANLAEFAAICHKALSR